jgi:hypothetical protein
MELLKPANKGTCMNCLEKLPISLNEHQNTLIQEQNTSKHNPPFKQLDNTQPEHACS